MKETYYTISQDGQNQIEIKKSKFICHLFRIDNEKQAREYINQIKKEHGSFTVELKYFRSMPWYKAIFLSNFFNFILVLSTYFMVK